MQKLSELVNFYNHLCALTSTEVKNSTDLELQKITHLVPELENLRSTVLTSFNAFEDEFDQVKHKVFDQIRQEEKLYLQDSYKIYEQRRSRKYEWFKMELPAGQSEFLQEQRKIKEKETEAEVNAILNTGLDISEENQNFIISRLHRYTGWQSTTMILHPGVEPWINHLVSNDPLYILDENYDLLKPVLEQFNEVYQKRLRPYVIYEDQDQDILWQMPNEQFGLILSYNYFNHRPFEVIRRYLVEFYKKMRPGGTLLMTYNDCDRWPGVVAAETGVALYTPGFLIREFAQSLGFEQTFIWHTNGPWTWIEFRKPGEWKSLRGGQALAKIIPK
jgi:SAM-dependent methyltransferase